MEQFARLSYAFTAGDGDIEDDAFVNQMLNEKLATFVKTNKVIQYRILNAETATIPGAAIGPGYEGVQCSIFIAYTL